MLIIFFVLSEVQHSIILTSLFRISGNQGFAIFFNNCFMFAHRHLLLKSKDLSIFSHFSRRFKHSTASACGLHDEHDGKQTPG